MPDSLLTQLQNLRQLFAEALPEDSKTLNDYAWTIVKALLQHTTELDSLTARQLLADCLKLPTERPSGLHSALLSAAIKVAAVYPEFRFAAFLKLWGVQNLRPEDYQRQQATVPAGSPAGSLPVSRSFPAGNPQVSSSFAAGKSFPSLAEKTTKALAHSLLLHPEDELTANLVPLLQSAGYVITNSPFKGDKRGSLFMLVTRIKEAVSKEGRKLIFVTLTSSEGLEVECVSSQLQPSPLHPLPEGKRHYVNIGQLYDCLLKTKATVPAASPSGIKATVPAGSPAGITLTEAYLSTRKPTEVFPTEVGYLESIDQQHGHMHVFDAHSRHFVAPVLRFSRERVGEFVRFIPIVPAASKFKTAIIQGTIPGSVLSLPEREHLLRDIRITHINKEKGYAAWELTDKEHPITELLSPLQLSQGETSPTFTTGYLNLATVPDGSPSGFSVPLREGWEGSAFIYLKRGKDRQKRPHVAFIAPRQ